MKSAILCFPYMPGMPQYPTGLYKIATYCLPDFRVHVLDQRVTPDIDQEIGEILSQEEVLCIGVSCMTGTQIAPALQISRRYHGDVPVVWGGVHPTLLPEQTMEDEAIDHVVRGDGEQAFRDLLTQLSRGRPPRDLAGQQAELSDFHDFARQYVDFEAYPVNERYFVNRDGLIRAFNIETSRGCPHKCGYCHNSAMHPRYRTIGPQMALGVVDQLIQRHGIRGVVFQEDNFLVDRARAGAILSGLAARDLRWKANARLSYVGSFTDSFLELIERSGCSVLQFGVESGSQRILDLIGKGLSVEDIVAWNRRLASRDFAVRYNFIVGFPTEDPKEIQATLDLMGRLRDDNPRCLPPFLNIYCPYPGTPLFDLALEHGFVPPRSLPEWNDVTWNSVSLPWLDGPTNRRLQALSERCMMESEYARFVKAEF